MQFFNTNIWLKLKQATSCWLRLNYRLQGGILVLSGILFGLSFFLPYSSFQDCSEKSTLLKQGLSEKQIMQMETSTIKMSVGDIVSSIPVWCHKKEFYVPSDEFSKHILAGDSIPDFLWFFLLGTIWLFLWLLFLIFRPFRMSRFLVSLIGLGLTLPLLVQLVMGQFLDDPEIGFYFVFWTSFALIVNSIFATLGAKFAR